MATISADFLIADKLSQYELLWGIKIRNLTNSTMCLRRDWPEYRSVSLDNCCQMWSVHLGLLDTRQIPIQEHSCRLWPMGTFPLTLSIYLT